jgi:hypothetical protein
MRRILLLCLGAPALSAQAQSIDAALLPGSWRGEGRYYETRLQRANRPPEFELSIGPDLTLSGTVGGARIVPARPAAVGPRIDYAVVLDGPVAAGKSLDGKDHLMVLITVVGRDSFSADFHLKSRFGFDFSMHPGSLEAVRADGD